MKLFVTLLREHPCSSPYNPHNTHCCIQVLWILCRPHREANIFLQSTRSLIALQNAMLAMRWALQTVRMNHPGVKPFTTPEWQWEFSFLPPSQTTTPICPCGREKPVNTWPFLLHLLFFTRKGNKCTGLVLKTSFQVNFFFWCTESMQAWGN